MHVPRVEGQQREVLEAKILAAYREVLGIADAGIDENFFDIGGSSLSAARLAGKLAAELGRSVSAVDILTHPSVRILATAMTGNSSALNREQADQRAALQRRAFTAHRTMRG